MGHILCWASQYSVWAYANNNVISPIIPENQLDLFYRMGEKLLKISQIMNKELGIRDRSEAKVCHFPVVVSLPQKMIKCTTTSVSTVLCEKISKHVNSWNSDTFALPVLLCMHCFLSIIIYVFTCCLLTVPYSTNFLPPIYNIPN